MSKPTIDFRCQVTRFIDRALEAEARGMGEDKQAVARRILDEWARKRHSAFKVYARSLKADGLQMELDVDSVEDDGAFKK